jgi:hypothetical protein
VTYFVINEYKIKILPYKKNLPPQALVSFKKYMPPPLIYFKVNVRNRPIRNKNCLWRPCLSTDRDEMCNLYRIPSIVASYHVSVHLTKQFEKRRFLYDRPIRLFVGYREWPSSYDWLFLFLIGRFKKKSSPLKVLSQMNRNLVDKS